MITSLQNPLVKQIRKLHRTKGRREQNLFLLEGTHLIETACEVNYPLFSLCYTEQWQARHLKLWETVSERVQRCELVSPAILAAIATTVNPDGVIATAIFQPFTNRKITNLGLGLILERLQDPGNLGTIIRTAAATEIDGIWLTNDSVDINNPKVLRASAGAWFKVPMMVDSDLESIILNYRQAGVKIVATLPNAHKNYWDLDFKKPALILLGNEGSGLSNKLISLANENITIPMSNDVESLNVAITASLILYERQRQLLNITY